MAKFEWDHPLRRRQMQVWWVKIGHFQQKMRYNSNRKSYVLYQTAMYIGSPYDVLALGL